MAILTWIAGGRRQWAAGWRRVGWLAGLVALCCAAPVAVAQPATSTEYQLKAAFLYKLAQFVEWPARAFPAANAPLVVGVLGEDPFGPYLDDLVKGEKVGDRPLIVRRFKRVQEIGECHILFVCQSEAPTLEAELEQLKGRSILTVGDIDAFARRGGMVRFVTENGKIRLRVHLAAAKAGDLTISSKILSPATIVGPGNW